MNTLKTHRSFIFFCFWLSGATALIYEVLWMRYFTDLMGSTSLATSLILTSYMGGMALGAGLARRWADKLVSGIRTYGWLEFAVGAYALLTPLFFRGLEHLYPFLLQALPAGLFFSVLLRFVLACLVLLIPTACMGATLPIMVKAMTRSDQEVSTQSGWLYGVNTLGAVSGVLLAGFWLMPSFGVVASVTGVAILNMGLGLAVVGLSFAAPLPQAESPPAQEAQPPRKKSKRKAQVNEQLPAQPSHWPYLVIFMSGAVAMSYEVAWTRLLSIIFGTSTYAFTLILATFLTGLALGSLALGYWGDRLVKKIPLLLSGLLALAALSTLITLGLLARLPYLFGFIYLKLQSTGLATASSEDLAFLSKAILAVLIMLPPTFFLGGLFPLIIRQIQTDSDQKLGHNTANAYVFNTLGAVSGSLLAGFGIGPLLGLYSSVYVGTGVLLLLSTFVLFKTQLSQTHKALAASLTWAVILGVGFTNPSYDARQLFLEAFQTPEYVAELVEKNRFDEYLIPAENIVYYRDGISSTVLVGKFGKHLALLTDGKGDASTVSELMIRKALAHLPLTLAPQRANVMVIGLGGGQTVSSALKHPLRSLDVVEIESAVVEACRKFFTPFIGDIFADPRLEVHIDDAKNFVRQHPQHFDVIISQGSHPWRAGSSRLFTQEFWQHSSEALKPKGVFAQWVQLYQIQPDQFKSILGTFQSVFPYTHLFRFGQDGVLLGSHEPLILDLPHYLKQSSVPEVLADLKAIKEEGWKHITPIEMLAHYDLGPEEIRELTQKARLNTVHKPFIEFSASKALLDVENLNYLQKILNQIPTPYDRYISFEGLSAAQEAALTEDFLTALQTYRPDKQIELKK